MPPTLFTTKFALNFPNSIHIFWYASIHQEGTKLSKYNLALFKCLDSFPYTPFALLNINLCLIYIPISTLYIKVTFPLWQPFLILMKSLHSFLNHPVFLQFSHSFLKLPFSFLLLICWAYIVVVSDLKRPLT